MATESLSLTAIEARAETRLSAQNEAIASDAVACEIKGLQKSLPANPLSARVLEPTTYTPK
jgi:hypothetical protein